MKLVEHIAAGRREKLAVCIPCRDQVQSIFSYSLIKLVQYCSTIKLPVNVFMQTGSLISKQRQDLAEAAIKSGATYILWLDSDMSFPPSIAETLMSHNTDIVACNYSTRSMPRKGVAYTKIGDWNSWIKPTDTVPRLQSVEGVGMGCMLTKIDVFSKIEKPWFEVSWSEEYSCFIGEDFYFCRSAEKSGYKIMVDTVLSRSIKHIGISEFDLATATGW